MSGNYEVLLEKRSLICLCNRSERAILVAILMLARNALSLEEEMAGTAKEEPKVVPPPADAPKKASKAPKK
jgi:hypothetical protein